jgi:formylglycine-generating enzyme required for sulfatase activity
MRALLRSSLSCGLLVLLVSLIARSDDPEPKPLRAPVKPEDAMKARAAWAKHLKVPERKTLDLGEGVTLELVLIPGGIFTMGAPATEKGALADERPHEVEISRPFYLAVTETTQEQYKAVTGKNPSQFTGDLKRPVEMVSWDDAVTFCDKVGLAQRVRVSLPTEAQWEYACRAGTTTPFHFGDSLTAKQANFNGELPYGSDEKGPSLKRTEKVASYPANAFGLHDMHGNVREWCRDAYQKDTTTLDRKDPVTELGSGRVVRGGSWVGDARFCRSSFRNEFAADRRNPLIGFRIAVLP